MLAFRYVHTILDGLWWKKGASRLIRLNFCWKEIWNGYKSKLNKFEIVLKLHGHFGIFRRTEYIFGKRLLHWSWTDSGKILNNWILETVLNHRLVHFTYHSMNIWSRLTTKNECDWILYNFQNIVSFIWRI